jgi:hypothetical protein
MVSLCLFLSIVKWGHRSVILEAGNLQKVSIPIDVSAGFPPHCVRRDIAPPLVYIDTGLRLRSSHIALEEF